MIFEDRSDAAEQLARIRERRAAWSRLRPPINPEGRVVIVVVDVPESFGAVSQFYRSFSQVEDEEVAQLLVA